MKSKEKSDTIFMIFMVIVSSLVIIFTIGNGNFGRLYYIGGIVLIVSVLVIAMALISVIVLPIIRKSQGKQRKKRPLFSKTVRKKKLRKKEHLEGLSEENRLWLLKEETEEREKGLSHKRNLPPEPKKVNIECKEENKIERSSKKIPEEEKYLLEALRKVNLK